MMQQFFTKEYKKILLEFLMMSETNRMDLKRKCKCQKIAHW